MKFLTSKKNLKIVSLILVLITIINVFIPISSYAAVEEFGGKLFKPIFKLFATVGDLVISGLQKIFIGNGDITVAELAEIEEETFRIKYSPGIIFSNEIPGLDANFIKPSEDLIVTTESATWENMGDYDLKSEELKEYGFNPDTMKPRLSESDDDTFLYVIKYNNKNYHLIYEWTYEEKKYTLINTSAGGSNWDDSLIQIVDGAIQETVDKIQELLGKEWTLYELKINAENVDGRVIESTASQLQGTISKWYKGLRLIAMVGLLSVLVYVGIRIIISSTGQEKAKYKKMIGDWIAAICILFILQYIMSFTMTIVENVIDIFKTNVVGVNGEDILMSSIRQKIGNTDSFSTIFTELILYLVLVIYTVVFTIHYLKRLVYLAFFTMIAPLIALTYPLDKIKDGQAQAFGMWIKEYVFNALIPVMHIVLYSIFVGSAMDFAQQNPLYAIVCIAFLIPAEKFIRKMFGFDKATTSSQIGAAAGGAMVMNAINKFASNGQGGNSNGGAGNGATGKSGGVRTATNSPYQGLQAGGSQTGGLQAGGSQTGGLQAGGSQTGGLQAGNTQTGNTQTGNTQTGNNNGKFGKFIKGAKGVAKNQLFTKPAAQRNLRAMAKALGGAAGLTAGLAAGVASGDLSKVGAYSAAGIAAGAKGAGGLVNKGFGAYDSARSGIDNLMYQGRTEIYGEEEARNLRFNDQFMRSQECKDLVKRYKNTNPEIEGNIRTMLNAGITDPERMNTIIKNMNSHQGSTLEQAIAYNQLATDCSDSILNDNKKLRTFLDSRGIRYGNYMTDDNQLAALRQSIVDFK